MSKSETFEEMKIAEIIDLIDGGSKPLVCNLNKVYGKDVTKNALETKANQILEIDRKKLDQQNDIRIKNNHKRLKGKPLPLHDIPWQFTENEVIKGQPDLGMYSKINGAVEESFGLKNFIADPFVIKNLENKFTARKFTEEEKYELGCGIKVSIPLKKEIQFEHPDEILAHLSFAEYVEHEIILPNSPYQQFLDYMWSIGYNPKRFSIDQFIPKYDLEFSSDSKSLILNIKIDRYEFNESAKTNLEHDGKTESNFDSEEFMYLRNILTWYRMLLSKPKELRNDLESNQITRLEDSLFNGKNRVLRKNWRNIEGVNFHLDMNSPKNVFNIFTGKPVEEKKESELTPITLSQGYDIANARMGSAKVMNNPKLLHAFTCFAMGQSFSEISRDGKNKKLSAYSPDSVKRLIKNTLAGFGFLLLDRRKLIKKQKPEKSA